MLPATQQESFLIAQDYDVNKSAPNEQITVQEAARHDVNGGKAAIATWAIPLVLALILVLYFFGFRKNRGVRFS